MKASSEERSTWRSDEREKAKDIETCRFVIRLLITWRHKDLAEDRTEWRGPSDQARPVLLNQASIHLAQKEQPHGEIIGAGLVAHAPTVMMSRRIATNFDEGEEISLVRGCTG